MERGHEFQPVAHTVECVEPTKSREFFVPREFDVRFGQPLGQLVETSHENAGMSLARRTEILFDTEVDLEPVATNPQAAASREHRRFAHLPQAEYLDVEPPAFRLTTRRDRQLDVV
ncbi:hypothetical protein [Nocardia sp. NPDC005745]|uniref:hypothetical protein n=1 Tax=Nocardia sp. NPDC005745 TaxID=3157061 RepID=UPI0033CD3FCB